MKEQRITKTLGVFMITVAVFFDLIAAGINLIPVAGQIFAYLITIFAYLVFWFWFNIKNISLISIKQAKKMVLRFLGPAALEIITFGIAPGLTLSVMLTISQVKIEDRKNDPQKIQQDQIDEVTQNTQSDY